MRHSDGRLMNADELAQYLGVTRNAAYTLLHSNNFPTVRVGSLLFAVREEVDIWIRKQAQKGGYKYE